MTRSRFFLCILIGFFLLAIGYHEVQARLAKTEVRDFVQDQVQRILKADVKIAKLRYEPPFQIALQGIQIEHPSTPLAFSIARIDRLVLGYGLLNLLRRDFKIPTTFRLDSPQIHFRSNRLPFPFLDSISSPSKRMPLKWVIQKGEFHYPWGDSSHELILSKVRFQAKPDARGQIRLELASELGGVAQGAIRVRGFTDPQFHHYELEVRLEEVTFLLASGVPLKKIRGRFRVSNQSIEALGVTSLLHDWDIQWKGHVENWQLKPRVVLDIVHKKGKTPFRFSIQMDFESHRMSGEWSWLGRPYPFQGQVFQDGKKILFPRLTLPHGYKGKARLNRSSGDYEISFQRERRRFQVRSNLRHLEFDTEFRLDHASINRLDWVVLGRARIVPSPERPEGGGPQFTGEVHTDYFIVEFEPLADFQGSFEFGPEGFTSIDCRWGRVFQLGGRILLKGGEPREDLALRVEGFPLETIREFARRPLPTNLRGVLEGKLKLRGEPARPEVQGYFTIKEGTIERLNFDRAVIQFQGYPPYLRLYDSKIFRGRSTLKLLGAINLKLANFFHGIQIKGPDHLVIWKGMSAYWKQGESAIEAEKPLASKLAMGLEVGAGVSDSKRKGEEESHAVVGPKVRF